MIPLSVSIATTFAGLLFIAFAGWAIVAAHLRRINERHRKEVDIYVQKIKLKDAEIAAYRNAHKKVEASQRIAAAEILRAQDPECFVRSITDRLSADMAREIARHVNIQRELMTDGQTFLYSARLNVLHT